MKFASIVKAGICLVVAVSTHFCVIAQPVKNNGPLLYSTNFSSGIPLTDFVNPGNWVATKGGVTSTATGLTNYLMLFRQYSINNRTGAVRVNMGKDTKFNFFTVEMDNFHMWGTLVQADVANGLFKVYANYNADSAAYPPVLINHPYKFIPGRDYTIAINYASRVNKFIITDHATGLSDTIADTGGTSSGLVRDGFAMATESGTPPVVKSMTVSTGYPKGIKILYMGDSITEGLFMVPDAFTQHGKAAISGRSSGTVSGVQNRVWSELAYLKPKYVSILIGTNGSNTVANLTNLCQSIMRLGITPILNNIPWKAPAPVVADNAIITQVRKNLNLKGARFDVATSVDQLNLQQDTTIFADGVHPTAEGVHRMYRQLQNDVPELFK
ncbi:MAG: SGNH/GDSL hydrolase family protein [Sphingobacteriales bacterium]|nr:MAG: SGNH/GDSL hydrolase family protein [Sphingobacteriales bacterium]